MLDTGLVAKLKPDLHRTVPRFGDISRHIGLFVPVLVSPIMLVFLAYEVPVRIFVVCS
jgi:hypothetical protein